MFCEEATLLCVSIGKDVHGFPVETQTEHKVYIREKSVSRSEFYAALRENIRVRIAFEMRIEDWQDSASVINGTAVYPTKVIYEGAEYGILRTYKADKSLIEIICT